MWRQPCSPRQPFWLQDEPGAAQRVRSAMQPAMQQRGAPSGSDADWELQLSFWPMPVTVYAYDRAPLARLELLGWCHPPSH